MDPLGDLIAWIAAYGVIGLVIIGLAERFVPVLPSYGVLVAIGMATADGLWSIFAAIAGTVAGSLVGCLALFAMALVLSERASHRLLAGASRLAGISPARVDRAVSSFRLNQRALAFGIQLVPAARLISPLAAGLFRANAPTFAIATAAGIALWNSLFIGVGHLAASIAPTLNASALAIKLLLLLVAVESVIGLAWRQWRRPAVIARNRITTRETP